MTDRLQAYVAFAEVMKRRNFTDSSRALGIPQPTISKHISSLEAALGVQLFVRSTRRTTPTAEAIELLPDILQMLEAHEEVFRKAKGVLPEVSGTVRIAAPRSYASYVLLPKLLAFRDEHPDLQFEMVAGSTISDLIAHELDLAFTDSDRLEGPYVQKVIARHEWLIGATPAYLERFGRPSRPVDLERHQVIVPARFGDTTTLGFESEDGHELVTISAPLRTDNIETACAIAARDKAIVVAPDWVFTATPFGNGLDIVMRDFFIKAAPMRLIYPTAQFVPARTRRLIDFISEG